MCGEWIDVGSGGGGYRSVGCLLVCSWISVSNMAFGLDVFVSFIWIFSCVILYMWNFSRVSISFPISVVWRTSMILSIGPKEWLFSSRW